MACPLVSMSTVLLAAMWLMPIIQSAPAQEKPTSTETVLSGCLRDARADTTNADPKGVIYTLEAAASTSSTTPAPISGAAQAAAVAKTRYALSVDGSVDLSKHVGHHVQLTGKLLSEQRTSQNASAPAPTAAKPLPGAAHRTFQVTGLKMIAAKCP